MILYAGETNIANTVATKVQSAIKQKASQEELMEILKEIPDDDGEQQTNPLKVNITRHKNSKLLNQYTQLFPVYTKFFQSYKLIPWFFPFRFQCLYNP